MELKFQHALYGVGGFLVLLGAASALLSSGGQESSGGLVEVLSTGVSSAFMALFSGIPIGVGAALVANGLSFRLRGNHSHVALSFVFCALSVGVAIVSVAELKSSNYFLLVLFFAGMAAAAAFLFSAVAFVLSGALSTYIAEHSPRAGFDHKPNKG